MIRGANNEEISYLNTLTDYKITVNCFNKILIYISDNKILGFIDYSKMYEKMELNFIYVINEYRKLGIATKLLNVMFDNDYENITLEVSVLNDSAINLYKKNNFEIIGIRKGYYNGTDAYLMERR